ncbi:MAG: cell division protein DedD, partial [Nanoarchaeota archaeon]
MENKRPSWDEYFMNVAHSVRERATCDRGRAGCVIVKDKRILTTGYVGSPAGLAHCDEAGHIIKELKHEDGSITKHCLRTI